MNLLLKVESAKFHARPIGRAHHSVRAVCTEDRARRARSDAPDLPGSWEGKESCQWSAINGTMRLHDYEPRAVVHQKGAYRCIWNRFVGQRACPGLFNPGI